jgi:hypothetical protein
MPAGLKTSEVISHYKRTRAHARNGDNRKRLQRSSDGSLAGPTFVLRLRPEPGIDPVRALRAALKVLLRRFGLKAIEVEART